MPVGTERKEEKGKERKKKYPCDCYGYNNYSRHL
jgi:hypothetical protein